MMIWDDVAFWDSWKEDFLEAETEEEDRQLERRLAARLDADLDEMFDDIERDPPHPAPVERARRSPRRPTLASALKEASKAGQHVAGALLNPGGQIELKFGNAASGNGAATDVDRELAEFEARHEA
jgi:hypothetical protein